MATMRTQHAGPVRMPFGEISGDRLQNLNSMKNRQNALQFAPTTKRKATESFNDSFNIFCDSEAILDTENIDPATSFKDKTNLYSQTNKRSKTSSVFKKPASFETIIKPPLSTSLPHNSTTSQTFTTTNLLHRKIAKPRSRLQKSKITTIFNDSPSTTDNMLQSRLNHPAGRSPTTGRPRVSSMLSGRDRPAAPAFGVARVRDSNRLVKSASLNSALGTAGALPFDISAAIGCTVPCGHPLRSIETTLSIAYGHGGKVVEASLPKSTSAPGNLLSPCVPKGRPAAWDFTIHEDTEDQERENIVSHDIEQLGVSDDEDSVTNRDSFASDKENMPPPDWEPTATPPRSQLNNFASALGTEPAIANSMIQYDDENSENYENSEMLATPRKHALSPTGEPAEEWERPVPGGLPISPGMMNLAQLSSPAPKKRRALGELPLEEFVPADAEEEEAKAKEQGEKGEGWLMRDGRLSPIDEDGSVEEEVVVEEDFENSLEVLQRCDEDMGSREKVQVIIHPPRTSSLPGAGSI